jgi:hypothetical protein
MEEREDDQFSWTTLFLVTGISFWGFSIILRLLDASHVTLFSRIGIVSVILGTLGFLNTWLSRKVFANKSTVSSDRRHQ